MCHNSTIGPGRRVPELLLASLLAGGAAFAQTVIDRAPNVVPDWRRIGNSAVEASLASVATGPVERVWYSAEGLRVFIMTRSGKVFQTEDFENWRAGGDDIIQPPAEAGDQDFLPAEHRPESGARVRPATRRPGLVYAVGTAVYRSDDGGLSWRNLTRYKGYSILGDGLKDLAVSPRNEDEIVVAGRFGVWRSMDGGLSWSGLNQSLANLPVRRLLRLPAGGQGTRLLLNELGEVEWAPGETIGWRPVSDHQLERETALKRALSAVLGAEVLSVAVAEDSLYAGSADGGRLWSSTDRGRSWRLFAAPDAGAVEDIFVAADNPRVALAALGAREGGSGVHILRTTNGGIFWDDLTADLPDVAAHAVTADYSTGGVYAATDAGVFYTVADLLGAGPATSWTSLTENLTGRAAFDARLDEAGNQLYIAIDGEGVFAATAPHRFLAPSVVSAADLSGSVASPGALMSVLGRRVQAARAGDFEAPVLAAADGESQIQVPFEAAGPVLSLVLTAAGAGGEPERYALGVALRDAAPAIFISRDGTPMMLDADSGILLAAVRPARSGSRIQILATGLGKVQPDWPTGLAGPLENPPQVVAPVRVFVDRTPVEVTRATLAAGYVGFYLIEVRLPDIVNAGPAELYLEVGGEQSNRTRLYLEP